MKKIHIFALCLIISIPAANAQNKSFRDYTDILRYTINLNISNIAGKTLSGNTELVINLRQNPDNEIKLDFEALTVDSVFIGNTKIHKYLYDKRYLSVPFDQDISENITLTTYYHGTPAEDPAWGGFFFSDSVAFNMGVGMNAEIKGFGRVWYPCNDSFTDKAYYTYNITVAQGNKAVCSGILADSAVNADKTVTYTWKMNKQIPTYVSSVAVGNYKAVTRIYKGIKRNIPVDIYTKPYMVAAAEYSFQNLLQAIKLFENSYGEYVWDRIGYVTVPFQSGAMEHACNIAYPDFAVTGDKTYETLYAHELSHSWFGNLVTCKTAADMWLNEGWASFSEALFKEAVYGNAQYKDYVSNNHLKVLTYTHTADGGYFPVYGIPNNITYGSTVYDKGADVVYALRGYMGDELFFSTLKSYFIDNAFNAISTQEFMQYFETKSKLNLKDFFDTWIFTAGFPHFSIKNFNTKYNNNKYIASVTLQQRLRERTFYGQNNKVELLLIDKDLKTETVEIIFSGEQQTLTFSTDILPETIILDPYQKLPDTKVSSFTYVKRSGETYFDYTNFSVFAQNVTDSFPVYCAVNYIEPQNAQTENYTTASYMYWTIAGVYNGDNNNIRTEFFINTLDNKIYSPAADTELLYRPSSEHKFETIQCDKQLINEYECIFKLPELKFGEYAIGIKKI